MGLTMECARCHDHKYDPISQKEYFELSAFFNNVKELGLASADGNAGPTVLLPEKEVEEKLKFINEKIAEQEMLMKQHTERHSTSHYDELIFRNANRTAMGRDGLVAHYPLDEIAGKTSPNLAN